MKKKNIIRFLIILIIGSYFLYKLFNAVKSNLNSYNEDLPTTTSLNSDFLNLFKNEIKNQIKVVEIRNSKIRPSIPHLIYKEKYDIVIDKFIIENELPIHKIVEFKNQYKGQTNGETYKILENLLPFKYKYRSGDSSKANKIILSFWKDSPKNFFLNNTLLYCTQKCAQFALQFDEDGPVNLFVTTEMTDKNKNQELNMEFLFLKKEKFLYFIIMTGNNYNESFNDESLLKMLNI